MFAGVPMSGHPCNARNPKDVLHVLRIYRCNSRNHLSRGCQGPLWKCQPKTKLEAGRLRYIVRTDLFGSFKPPENLSFWLPCDKRTTAAHMPPWKKVSKSLGIIIPCGDKQQKDIWTHLSEVLSVDICRYLLEEWSFAIRSWIKYQQLDKPNLHRFRSSELTVFRKGKHAYIYQIYQQEAISAG